MKPNNGQLAALQKKEGTGNDRCCDCGAPSPQWVGLRARGMSMNTADEFHV